MTARVGPEQRVADEVIATKCAEKGAALDRLQGRIGDRFGYRLREAEVEQHIAQIHDADVVEWVKAAGIGLEFGKLHRGRSDRLVAQSARQAGSMMRNRTARR